MPRPVGPEVAADLLWRDVTAAAVGSRRGRQALGVSGWWRGAIEVEVGPRRQQAADAVRAEAQAVDLLEHARRVGVERLTAARGRCAGLGAVALPGLAVCLAGHVWQRVQAVFGSQLDLIDRH